MASEGEHAADADVAGKLTDAAKEALEIEPQEAGTEDAPAKAHSPASKYIQNVAHIVLDTSDHAADSSKAYIETAVHKVQDYAQNAASGSSSDIQETISKAVHVGAHPGEGNASTVSAFHLISGGMFMSCHGFSGCFSGQGFTAYFVCEIAMSAG